MALFIVSSIFLLSVINAAEGITFCNKTSACSCMGDDGLVDLSPLAGVSSPKFKDVTGGTAGGVFSWNPCNAFTEGACQNVAVCQVKSGTDNVNLGYQDSAKFQVFNGALTVTYSSFRPGEHTDVMTTIIGLKCDPIRDANFIVVGRQPPTSNVFIMSLNSKYACMGANGNKLTSLSIGSLLALVRYRL